MEGKSVVEQVSTEQTGITLDQKIFHWLLLGVYFSLIPGPHMSKKLIASAAAEYEHVLHVNSKQYVSN